MKRFAALILLAAVFASICTLNASATGLEEYNDYINEDGTYSYFFEQGITVTMPEEWYQNTMVKASGNRAIFLHKDSCRKFEEEGIENGGVLFTIGCSVNQDFKDLNEMTYIGFDEEECLNYYAVKPTDYQAYCGDSAVRKEYDRLFAEADDVIAGIQILSLEQLSEPHLPQEGELLINALSDEHMSHITEEYPVKIVMWIDRMGERNEAVVTDEETIREAVEAFSKIVVGKQTDEVVTDNYNGVIFYFEDGASKGVSLNLKNLEYPIVGGCQINELEQFDEFWKLMHSLTGCK